MNSKWVFRENSLDALRLFAAMQVAIIHTWEYLFPTLTQTLFYRFIELFPGVPIFFFISGYLISKSFERAPTINDYIKNRALRIFPALVICVFFNIVMVWSTGYFDQTQPSLLEIAKLFLAKASFLQFYNPDFMRAFGDGVLNGSLWTICVELQFYIITPILYMIFSQNKKISNTTLIILIAFFLLANQMLHIWREQYSSEVVWKLYRVSFVPWLYMFLAGILAQRNFDRISNLLSNVPTLLALAIYISIAFLLVENGYPTGNNISPILFGLITLIIIRLAYTSPKVINKIMRGNDISYGIYIWHMPIVNQFIYLNYRGEPEPALIALALSVCIAVLSWLLVEKPALKLKSFTLNTRLSAN